MPVRPFHNSMPVSFRRAFTAAGMGWLFCLLLFSALECGAREFPLEFTAIRLGSADKMALVVGGIQGDEPGGFSAASLLATRYEFSKGGAIVVPNLNFPSIIQRSRGLHGDMNRKFAALDANDPEFDTVKRIQDMIRQPEIQLVLNLHDGSGYYRPVWQDKLHNPGRWGQSIIIDQEKLAGDIFLGSLGDEAERVAKIANASLIRPEHALHVHNTNTAAGDREMEKSLSYYAVRHGKAAFGLEASKELPTALRAYYHLLMIEQFLKMAGCEFERDFTLTPAGVEDALRQNLGVSFAENRIFLPLEDVRSAINFLPLPPGSAADAITSKPIMAVLPCSGNSGQLCIHYGNRTITLIKPDWREADKSLDLMPVVVDGEEKKAPFGQILDVREVCQIKKVPGYRVNAIGVDKGLEDESGLQLRRRDFKDKFSVDRNASIFRVEVYKGKKFTGLFLVRFGKNSANFSTRSYLPDKPGPESEAGF